MDTFSTFNAVAHNMTNDDENADVHDIAHDDQIVETDINIGGLLNEALMARLEEFKVARGTRQATATKVRE